MHWGSERMGDRGTLVALHFAMTAVFILSTHIVGLLLPKIPVGALNLPNKDYWLEEARVEQTYGTATSYLLWLGNAFLLFSCSATYATLTANSQSPATLPDAFPLAGVACLVFVAGWTRSLLRRFRLP